MRGGSSAVRRVSRVRPDASGATQKSSRIARTCTPRPASSETTSNARCSRSAHAVMRCVTTPLLVTQRRSCPTPPTPLGSSQRTGCGGRTTEPELAWGGGGHLGVAEARPHGGWERRDLNGGLDGYHNPLDAHVRRTAWLTPQPSCKRFRVDIGRRQAPTGIESWSLPRRNRSFGPHPRQET